LRRENKGALFAYSVEVDEAEASGKSGHDTIGTADAPVEGLPMHKRIVEEMIHCIDVAADFEDQRQSKVGERVLGRRTWVALKLVSILL
jgi:proline dehydrogenase